MAGLATLGLDGGGAYMSGRNSRMCFRNACEGSHKAEDGASQRTKRDGSQERGTGNSNRMRWRKRWLARRRARRKRLTRMPVPIPKIPPSPPPVPLVARLTSTHFARFGDAKGTKGG